MAERFLLVAAALLAVVPAAGHAADPPVRTFTTGLKAPWDLAFLPDGRALVTERDSGAVRIVSRAGKLARSPLARIPVTTTVAGRAGGEGGLLGIALDPAFRRNGFVYLFRTREPVNEVVRYRLRDGRLRADRVIVSGIVARTYHNGGRLRFGPDGALYVTTGDATRGSRAQDPAERNGKVLRVTGASGGAPAVAVFTLGHRNVQGLDFDPRSGRLLASEHGPDAHDEINALVAGGNYGWPAVTGSDTGGGAFLPAFVDYPQIVAPSGAAFLKRRTSKWFGDFVVACLRGAQLRRLSFDSSGTVTADRVLLRNRFGRLRAVAEGPDGALYVTTSNSDGRGNPRRGDDRILRITPN